jgi:eukaryotic-like serine/threonine-protein kinase
VERTLGSYRLLRRIAVGGMAEVFAASDVGDRGRPGARSPDEPLVVKILLPQHAADPEFVQMFVDEARLTAGLDHPNLVRVHDFGQQGSEHFIVMERVDGPTLATLLGQLRRTGRSLPVPLVLLVAARLLEALQYIHSRADEAGRSLEIVHRDVTPGNVLLAVDGAIKLGDFGIARSRLRSGRTRTGVIKGTVQYMAPEQIADGGVDRRTDLYGVGLILFEMLAGAPYVVGEREVDLLRVAQDPPWRAPSSLRDDVDARLDRVLRPALTRFPEERYPEARAFLAALRQLDPDLTVDAEVARRGAQLGGLAREAAGDRAAVTPEADAVPDPPPASPAPPPRRSRSVILSVALALATAGGVATWLLTKAPRQGGASTDRDARTVQRPDAAARDRAPSRVIDRALETPSAAPDARRPRRVRVSRVDARPIRDARIEEIGPLRQRLRSALGALGGRGLLEEDLPATLRGRLATARQRLQGGSAAAARSALEELERELPTVKIDRSIVESKAKRVDQLLRAAGARPDAQRLRDRASVALQELMEGHFATANRQLNEILAALRR